MSSTDPHIIVKDLTMAFGSHVLQHDLTFTVNRGDIFIIMGGSGCGKSTLMRHLIGLNAPTRGTVFYGSMNFWESEPQERDRMMQRCGVMYQSGALWSSLTLVENISLSLEIYTTLKPAEIREIASLKLALVGLAGFEEYYPSEISGGMKKRAGIARAMALDPELLFLDEPSSGLDPISARLLDDLILELRESLDATVVIITHELASIFAIGTNSVFIDAATKTMIATGDPKRLLKECGNATVQNFLTRGEAKTKAQPGVISGPCFLARDKQGEQMRAVFEEGEHPWRNR